MVNQNLNGQKKALFEPFEAVILVLDHRSDCRQNLIN